MGRYYDSKLNPSEVQMSSKTSLYIGIISASL